MTLFCLAVLAALLWPIGYAMWISFTPGEMLLPPKGEWSLRWYRTFFDRPEWSESLGHSLGIGVLAALTAAVTGTSAAVAVSRYRFPGQRLLRSVVMLPLFVPALILGLALLPVVRITGLWGSPLSVAFAHGLQGLPLVFLAVRGALEDMDRNLEAAARGLGAGGREVFLWVTLPSIAPAVATGALLAFIVSFNELIIALFLCTPAIDTLPKVIWPNLRYTLSPLVAAASGIAVLTTLVPALAAWWFLSAKRGEKTGARASGP